MQIWGRNECREANGRFISMIILTSHMPPPEWENMKENKKMATLIKASAPRGMPLTSVYAMHYSIHDKLWHKISRESARFDDHGLSSFPAIRQTRGRQQWVCISAVIRWRACVNTDDIMHHTYNIVCVHAHGVIAPVNITEEASDTSNGEHKGSTIIILSKTLSVHLTTDWTLAQIIMCNYIGHMSIVCDSKSNIFCWSPTLAQLLTLSTAVPLVSPTVGILYDISLRLYNVRYCKNPTLIFN